eukprot:GSMAST32.ASY1.ANO1.24.1 assembled CDS
MSMPEWMKSKPPPQDTPPTSVSSVLPTIDTHRPVRSARLKSKGKMNYTDLDGGIPIFDSEKFRKILLNESSFSKHSVRQLHDGSTLTKQWISSTNAFAEPFIVKRKQGLGLRVPNKPFSVKDVEKAVGWTLGDWASYYGDFCPSKKRDRILNVISLEVSNSPLGQLIEPPSVVRDISFLYTSWPKSRIHSGDFPRVQKYCLMSVAGSYTDFHIDFGGSSVWYHIIRGKKIFLMIPPTKSNLKKYEEWVQNEKQSEIFFADLCDDCFRVNVSVGNTLFLPSGWIHAVSDSLVFGGNYIHAFALPKQLAISDLEDRTKLPQIFRFPSYRELHWYFIFFQFQIYFFFFVKNFLYLTKKQKNKKNKKISKKKNIFSQYMYAAARYLRLLRRDDVTKKNVTKAECQNCVVLVNRLNQWLKGLAGAAGGMRSGNISCAGGATEALVRFYHFVFF